MIVRALRTAARKGSVDSDMKKLISSFAAILLCAVCASAQIQGRVTDVKGKGVPNVLVIATNETGELAPTVTTDAYGAYDFEDLQVGNTRARQKVV